MQLTKYWLSTAEGVVNKKEFAYRDDNHFACPSMEPETPLAVTEYLSDSEYSSSSNSEYLILILLKCSDRTFLENVGYLIRASRVGGSGGMFDSSSPDSQESGVGESDPEYSYSPVSSEYKRH